MSLSAIDQAVGLGELGWCEPEALSWCAATQLFPARGETFHWAKCGLNSGIACQWIYAYKNDRLSAHDRARAPQIIISNLGALIRHGAVTEAERAWIVHDYLGIPRGGAPAPAPPGAPAPAPPGAPAPGVPSFPTGGGGGGGFFGMSIAGIPVVLLLAGAVLLFILMRR